MQLIFNELSLHETLDKKEGTRRFKVFLTTYSKAVAVGFDRALLTYVDMNLISLAKDYYSAQWRNQETDRDMVRRYKGLCDRQQMCNERNEICEVQVNGRIGQGLLYALLHDEVAFSVCGQKMFEDFWIEGQYVSIKDNVEKTVDIQNISHAEDIEDHSELWKARKKVQYEADIKVDEFLEKLAEYYPTLVFGAVALKQLKNDIENQHFKTIRLKLYELEKVFLNWDGRKLDTAMFQSKMTSESKETLERFQDEHTFQVGDERVLASYHIRYTGNVDGRIYFYPNKNNRKCYICSLTTKLPTVSETKKRI